MLFATITGLVEKHAKLLNYEDSLGGGRGNTSEASRIMRDLHAKKEQLIIERDLRPSEIESKLPYIEVDENEFKSSIDFAKLGLVENISYQELLELIITKDD